MTLTIDLPDDLYARLVRAAELVTSHLKRRFVTPSAAKEE
jgi:hypothetical protein